MIMIRTVVTALCLTMAQFPAMAADDTESREGRLIVELNSSQDTASGTCQLTFVSENSIGRDIDRAAWQVAIFDRDGVVRGLPLLDFGALPAGRTRVLVFDLPGRSCAQIARIVVNDVAECLAAEGDPAPDLCLERLTTLSRSDIAFGI